MIDVITSSEWSAVAMVAVPLALVVLGFLAVDLLCGVSTELRVRFARWRIKRLQKGPFSYVDPATCHAMARRSPNVVVPRPARAPRSVADHERANLAPLRPVPKGNGRATDTVMSSSLDDDLKSHLHRRIH